MLKVILTHSFVYFFYIVLGGCIFLLLEGAYELGLKNKIDPKESSSSFSDLQIELLEGKFTSSEVDTIVKEWDYRLRNDYFSDENPKLEDNSWSFANSFFFAFHLCSTIGYGDIAPRTSSGQIAVIVYAAIGVPLHILAFKLLGESFAGNYQETQKIVQGKKPSDVKKMLADAIFFTIWTVIFFVVPSVVFMFTEDWHFIEGFYYSFITLSTVGLGDYVAGGSTGNAVQYTVYKLLILLWMIYGLAYFCLVVDYLTHLFQMYLLFTFKLSFKPCIFYFERIYVDIEKLDIHFRLLRAEGVKHKYSMWAVRRGMRRDISVRSNHMVNLGLLAESVYGELGELVQLYEAEKVQQPEDALPEKKVPKDAFPVRKPK